jgi:repressor LexA
MPRDDGNLTPRRRNILSFIRESTARRGYPPSMREIADAVGLKSTSAVSHQLKILEGTGYLTHEARMPRTAVAKPPCLGVVPGWSGEFGEAPAGIGSLKMVSVPLFERIAAGAPVIANPDSDDIMQLPSEMVGSGVLFAVRVAGDSMLNANILDGDYVVVRQQQVAENGDIVAARIEEEATVKTFQRVDGHVWLIPQNPNYPPILGDHCRLMGKVVATVHRI